ncbi:hypothetical protein SNUCP_02220 [Clostridium perfringens A]
MLNKTNKQRGGNRRLPKHRILRTRNKESILLVYYESEFYKDVVTDLWSCGEWMTKIV